MKIVPLKNYKWSIKYKAVSFSEGEAVSVDDDLAGKMIATGYASPEAPEAPESTTKETLVTENKAIQSSPENKKKPGRPKKIK